MSSIDSELSSGSPPKKDASVMVSFRLTPDQLRDLDLHVAKWAPDRSSYIISRIFGTVGMDRRALVCVAELHKLGISLRSAREAGTLAADPDVDRLAGQVTDVIERMAGRLS